MEPAHQGADRFAPLRTRPRRSARDTLLQRFACQGGALNGELETSNRKSRNCGLSGLWKGAG